MIRTMLWTAGVFTVITPFANAHWGMPQSMPVDRVIANLEAWVKDNPNDVKAWYSLARARSYAFAKTSGSIEFHGQQQRPDVSLGIAQNRVDVDKDKDLGAAVKHLDAGIRAFNSAIKLRPADADMRYGLACLIENGQSVCVKARAFPMLDTQVIDSQYSGMFGDGKDLSQPESLGSLKRFFLSDDGSRWSRSTDSLRAAEWVLARARFKQNSKEIDQIWAAAWSLEICDLYFTSACYALPEDSTAIEQSLTGLSPYISYQAAKDYLRVSEIRGLSESFPIRKAVAKSIIKAMEELPPCNAITPLVVPLDDAQCLDQVIDRGASIQFDFDGTGRAQTVEWIASNAAFLVWDPDRTGRITSGRQFFGSATWWVFFEDGFKALASLDNDGNGLIERDELTGLALWRDGNGNGVSDPGEVSSVEQWGIRSLSCRADGRDSDGLSARAGVVFDAGATSVTRPLWDWITTPQIASMGVSITKDDHVR